MSRAVQKGRRPLTFSECPSPVYLAWFWAPGRLDGSWTRALVQPVVSHVVPRGTGGHCLRCEFVGTKLWSGLQWFMVGSPGERIFLILTVPSGPSPIFFFPWMCCWLPSACYSRSASLLCVLFIDLTNIYLFIESREVLTALVNWCIF